MTAEFKRAAEVVDKVIVGTTTWSELFAPHDFFSKYRYYLQITASSASADAQLKWSGTVESKVRQLVMKLEYVDTLVIAHPFVKGFDRTSYCLNDVEMRAVSIGDVPTGIDARTSEDLDVATGGGTVWTTTFYIGLMIERKQAGANGPRKLDISYPTNEFTKLVKQWDKYDPETMGVIVRYMKSTALPDYVKDGKGPEPIKTSGTGMKRTKSGKSPTDHLQTELAPAQSDDVEPGQQPSKRIRSASSFTTVAPVPLISTLPPVSPTKALAAVSLAPNGPGSGANAPILS